MVTHCLIALTLLMQTTHAVPAGSRVVIHMTAVQATVEGRDTPYYGSGLDEVRSALTNLKFDTFRRITAARQSVSIRDTWSMTLNTRYTLHITPLDYTDERRIRLRVRIEERYLQGEEEHKRDALLTTLTLVPERHVRLGGLRLESGELIVILSAVVST